MKLLATLLVFISHVLSIASSAAVGSKSVLLIGGTRFSGLYLWKELHSRGHHVTLFNRGKTALKPLPNESQAAFDQRIADTKFVKGNRQVKEDLEKLGSEKFDVIYDMNGRDVTDTAPLADIFNGKVDHFVYMSSAGVYKKSLLMPHIEGDSEDPKSRHKGKLETEAYLKQIGIPYTSIRPTYIYGPLNYNPLEEYFFTRLDAGRPVCIPGHGQHLTGLGHVKDLATAMAQVIGKDVAKGQIYNIQDLQSVSFSGLARMCGKAMDLDPESIDIQLYDKKNYDFGEKKAFPMREQHFFCSIDKAMHDLEWSPKYNLLDGLKDSYVNDFRHKKAEGKLNLDFSCDKICVTYCSLSILSKLSGRKTFTFGGICKYTVMKSYEDKQIFALTCSGKPILCRKNDEDDHNMNMIYGVIQAIVSTLDNLNHKISSFQCGSKRVVFLLKNSIYLVCVSTSNEPEIVIHKQLLFIYSLIIMILTNRVNKTIESNYSEDIRNLLGKDMQKVLHTSCQPIIVPESIVFNAIPTYNMSYYIRKKVNKYLKECVISSNAVIGILVYEDKLIATYQPHSSPITMSTTDMMTLIHFCHMSPSFHTHEHNWVPICLPVYNENVYIQHIKEEDIIQAMFSSHTHLSHFYQHIPTTTTNNTTISSPAINNKTNIRDSSSGSSSSSGGGNMSTINSSSTGNISTKYHLPVNDRTPQYLSTHTQFLSAITQYIENKLTYLHLLFIYRPMSTELTTSSSRISPIKPTTPNTSGSQDISWNMRALWEDTMISVDNKVHPCQLYSTTSSSYTQDHVPMTRIYEEYYRLGVTMRCGSTLPDITLRVPSTQQNESHIENNILFTSPGKQHNILYEVLQQNVIIVSMCTSNTEFYMTFNTKKGGEVEDAIKVTQYYYQLLYHYYLPDLFQL